MQPVASYIRANREDSSQGCATSCPHCLISHHDAALCSERLVEILIADRSTPAFLCWEAERHLRAWARDGARRSQAKIEAACKLGRNKIARRERREHIAKRVVHLHALFIILRKQWPVLSCMSAEEREQVRRRRIRVAFEQLPQIGNFRKPARARMRFKPKRNGQGHRGITSFGWVDKARQYVLRSAFQPFANLHEAQFMYAHEGIPRGPAAVREAVLSSLADRGDGWSFLQFDIVDFYGSISHAWLESNLGIDPMVVSRHVHTGQMMIERPRKMATVHATHEANAEGGLRGIPQGSALSPIIADRIMAQVLRDTAVFDELPVYVWSDNVGVLAPRHREREIVGLVREAFERHGAGPFKLTYSAKPTVEEFKFLGINYRVDECGVPRAYIAEQIWSNWVSSIGSRLLIAGPNEIADIERHVAGKRATWSWWGGWPAIEDEVASLIASAKMQPGVSERIAA
jgi:RNA-directed DNA polymerase